MSHNKSLLKVLLLQIREAKQVKIEEHKSFARYCGLSEDQIKIQNVFEEPDFSPQCTQGYDALLVGGASDANVLEPTTYPFVAKCQDLLLQCAENNLPVFASCFGFQLATLALGGSIVHDAEHYEMGTLPIQLTRAASADPLFCDIDNGFYAVSVHKQKALKAPGNTIELAFTNSCVHSFRLQDKPFWAFQFHPEVDKATLIERLTHYKAKYTDNDDHLSEVLNNAKQTPQANGLCKRFVDRILLA